MSLDLERREGHSRPRNCLCQGVEAGKGPARAQRPHSVPAAPSGQAVKGDGGRGQGLAFLQPNQVTPHWALAVRGPGHLSQPASPTAGWWGSRGEETEGAICSFPSSAQLTGLVASPAAPDARTGPLRPLPGRCVPRRAGGCMSGCGGTGSCRTAGDAPRPLQRPFLKISYACVGLAWPWKSCPANSRTGRS